MGRKQAEAAQTPREVAAEAAHREASERLEAAKAALVAAETAKAEAAAELRAARFEADGALPVVRVCRREAWGAERRSLEMVVVRRTATTIWTRYRGDRGHVRAFAIDKRGEWTERSASGARFRRWLDADSVAALEA